MGILSNIFSKIFPSSHKAPAPAPKPATTTAAAPAAAPKPAAPAAAPAAAMDMVDVESILNKKAESAGQTLNWRSSIVDLLKLLDLDSSLQSRKELAQELDYKGDMGDSAAMNIWLHRQVMTRLAANGGKVPADLRD